MILDFRGHQMICVASGKVAYESAGEAQTALNHIGPRLADFSMRPYRCDRCGLFHVGHRNREQGDAAKAKTQAFRREGTKASTKTVKADRIWRKR